AERAWLSGNRQRRQSLVEHVKGHDLTKIMSKHYRHVPAPAGWLKTCHRTEGALADDDMLHESPRRPRRRGKVIEAVFQLGPLCHHGVRCILHVHSVACGV